MYLWLIGSICKATIVICLAWLFFRWKNKFQQSLLSTKAKKVDAGMVQVLNRLSTIAVLILAGLVILQIFDVNIAPLLAFGSIGAASIGFAGKDVIANFCSGIMLNITRPFIVGDQIFLPEKNLEGYIEEIGWFRTSLRDKQKRPVYLPNNFFSTQLVVNISRMTHRHLKQHIRIPFKNMDAIQDLTKSVKKILTSHHQIDKDLPMHAFLGLFGDSFAEIEIEAYCAPIDQDGFNMVQQEVLLLIHQELEKSGIEFAIPEVRLHQP
jgi:MscS family membrane protein